MKLLSTIVVEVFNGANVRTDFPPETRQITISEKNNDIYVIQPCADPLTPTSKDIPIVNTNSNYLAIFTDIPIGVIINSSATVLSVGILGIGGHLVLVGTDINTLTITNASVDTAANVNIIVGNVI
jgi:hypothetical protein